VIASITVRQMLWDEASLIELRFITASRSLQGGWLSGFQFWGFLFLVWKLWVGGGNEGNHPKIPKIGGVTWRTASKCDYSPRNRWPLIAEIDVANRSFFFLPLWALRLTTFALECTMLRIMRHWNIKSTTRVLLVVSENPYACREACGFLIIKAIDFLLLRW
jgi:hypothetical protein